MNARPDNDVYFLLMAQVARLRSTCVRRSVGCVLTDKRNHVLAIGYNGVPSGWTHCTDSPCEGAECMSGTGLDACEAIHAEQNAVLQCRDVYKIENCYLTASPCVPCTKLLLNTSCRRIVFLEDYPHPESRDRWKRAGREWVHKPEWMLESFVASLEQSKVPPPCRNFHHARPLDDDDALDD